MELTNLKSIITLIKNFTNKEDTLEFNEKKKLLSDLIEVIFLDGLKLEIKIKTSEY